MEHKRSSSLFDVEGDTKKRKVLDTLSEDGPLTQEDVVYFQKEAIFRKLSLCRRELAVSEKALQEWRAKCKANADKLVVLESWWASVIELLGCHGLVLDTDAYKNVLYIFDELEDGRSAEIDRILELRKKILLDVVSPLLKKTSDAVEIKDKLESVAKDSAAEKSRRLFLEQENQVLTSSVKSLRSEVLNLTRINDRLTSKTLKRTDEALLEEPEPEVKLEEPVSNGVASNGQSHHEKESTVEVNDEKLEDLTVCVAELQANVATLSKQLEEETTKSLQFKQQVATYEIRLANLTEGELQNSIVYQTLLSRVDKLTKENTELSRKDATLLNKIAALESNQTKFKEEFEGKMTEERKMLQTQLEKAESDLTRVRANRDELISKLELLKADKKSKELYEELTNMINIQKKEIETLKSETRKELVNTNYDDVSLETLQKQNQALIIELKDIETAFNTAQSQLNKKLVSAVANENLITKLKLEKNKADQKYFAAMRAKDALTNELKTLKIQQARSNELISQMKEAEKLLQTKNKVLENNLENFKTVGVEKTKEFDVLKNKSVELLKSFDNLKKKYDQLCSDKKISIQKTHENEEQISILKKDLELSKQKNTSLEKLISKYRKKGDNADFKEDDARLEGLISIAKCSICSIRFKNTALKSCGHVFCSECVNDRLAARLRKCPSCNCAFSHNDLLSVHL